MVNKFAKFNIIIVSAFIYSLCVYLTLQQEEVSRIYVYRFLTILFILLLFILNFNSIISSIKLMIYEFKKKMMNYFGYKYEIKKEDKVRTFIE